ncbi:hypothetical protein SAMN05443431_104241 [Olleya namhaensis]|uniref:Por secretion system C-terminal sorting domain-containing protein n=2 Tax=Olleya namhaensis TaxID=1144750 RepID=A0A1I3NRY1_9FLAO|nr:hypothetical protein SAMN05443431_104241 [Olleya namhaensis]
MIQKCYNSIKVLEKLKLKYYIYLNRLLIMAKNYILILLLFVFNATLAEEATPFNNNNLTYDSMVSVIDASDLQDNKTADFSAKMVKNQLLISNYKGKVTIKAYSILGKEILRLSDIDVTNTFRKTLDLPKNQISIIVIETPKFRHSLKVVL